MPILECKLLSCLDGLRRQQKVEGEKPPLAVKLTEIPPG